MYIGCMEIYFIIRFESIEYFIKLISQFLIKLFMRINYALKEDSEAVLCGTVIL